MNSLRDLVKVFFLVALFIVLSIFSITTYGAGNVTSSQEDKAPLVSSSVNKLGTVMAYLEQMPSLRLIPIAKSGNNYEATMTEILNQSKIIDTNIGQISTKNQENIKNAQIVISNKNGLISWATCKWHELQDEMLDKDWSRP
jgi:hypothetical protein